MKNRKFKRSLKKLIKAFSRIRTYRGYTPTELARRADLSPTTVLRVERGEVTPTLETIGKIARALELELDIVKKTQ